MSRITADEIITRYSFQEKGLRLILFKTSDYVPAWRDGDRLYIFMPIPEELGYLDFTGGEALFKGAKVKRMVCIMNPENYPHFSDMMAGRVVLQEFAKNYEIKPKGNS